MIRGPRQPTAMSYSRLESMQNVLIICCQLDHMIVLCRTSKYVVLCVLELLRLMIIGFTEISSLYAFSDLNVFVNYVMS